MLHGCAKDSCHAFNLIKGKNDEWKQKSGLSKYKGLEGYVAVYSGITGRNCGSGVAG